MAGCPEFEVEGDGTTRARRWARASAVALASAGALLLARPARKTLFATLVLACALLAAGACSEAGRAADLDPSSASAVGPGSVERALTLHPSFQTSEGAVWSGQVAVASCAVFSSTIAWGDGTSSPGSKGDAGAIDGTHAYAEEGTYIGTVSWQDDCGSETSIFIAQVNDAPLTATATSVTATAGETFSGTVASFGDADPIGTAADYGATVDWGDGSSSSGTITASNGSFAVTATHTYATSGTSTTTISVSDAGGAKTAASGTAIISAGATAPPPPTPPPTPPPLTTPAPSAPIHIPRCASVKRPPNPPLPPVPDPYDYLLSSDGTTLTFGRFDAKALDGCWVYVSDVHPRTGLVVPGGGLHVVPQAPPGVTSRRRVPAAVPPPKHTVVGVSEIGGYFETTGRIVVNGLLLTPVDPGASSFAADTLDGTLACTGVCLYTVRVDGLQVGVADFALQPWTPAGTHLADLNGANGAIHGLPLTGRSAIDLGHVFGTATVSTHLLLPAFRDAPLPGSSSSVPVVLTSSPTPEVASRRLATAADAQGPTEIDLPTVFLGVMAIHDAVLKYDPSSDEWRGQGGFDFGGVDLAAHFSLRDGSFVEGGAGAIFPDPGVPSFVPGVSLKHINVDVGLGPTRFHGTLGVNFAGGLLKADPIGLFAVFASPQEPYTYNQDKADNGGQDDLPGIDYLQTDTRRTPITSPAFGVAGQPVLHIPYIDQDVTLGNAYAFLIPPYFEFAGRFNESFLGNALSLGGYVDGAADLGSGRFKLEGNVSACANWPSPIGSTCIGASGIVSSRGIAACGQIKVIHEWDLGFRYYWGDAFPTLFLDGCNFGNVEFDVRTGDELRALQGAGTQAASFHLPAGLAGSSITVTGRGGTPAVAIAGPGGEHATSDPAGAAMSDGRIVILPMARLNETLIGISHPGAGSWTVRALPGSVPITGVAHANAAATPRIAVHVAGAGSRRTLTYRIDDRAGQTVTFAEQGPQTYHVIGAVRGNSGQLTYTVAPGAAGPRSIVAQTGEGGLISRQLVVARYAVPRAEPPAPRPLRASRRADTLRVTWGASAGAKEYLVAIDTTDGQHTTYAIPNRHRTLALAGLSPAARVTIRVIAQNASERHSPAATITLPPALPPARITGLRAIRTGSRLTISWNRADDAVRYAVQIQAGAHRVALATTRPAIAIYPVRKTRSLRVTIAALDRTSRSGPRATIIVRRSPG